jgi:Na+-translocating ferredoxin:NAD+ oxidoreductase RnfA subunit
LKVGQVDINGNVYGKVAVAKHFNLIMVNYIGFKEKNQYNDLFRRFQGSAQYLLVKYDDN